MYILPPHPSVRKGWTLAFYLGGFSSSLALWILGKLGWVMGKTYTKVHITPIARGVYVALRVPWGDPLPAG
jgi:hypothetical protein